MVMGTGLNPVRAREGMGIDTSAIRQASALR